MSMRNAAHSAVKSAVQQKRIPPARMLTCVDCGSGAQHYDHRDYSRPLDVAPVCRSCNRKRGPAVNADMGAHDRTAFGRWLEAHPRGTAAAVAATIGVAHPLMTQWGKGIRQMPADKAVAIEHATAGAVTCEEMRPDVLWVRMRDRKWPHPKGRPLVDLRIPKPAQEAA